MVAQKVKNVFAFELKLTLPNGIKSKYNGFTHKSQNLCNNKFYKLKFSKNVPFWLTVFAKKHAKIPHVFAKDSV